MSSPAVDRAKWRWCEDRWRTQVVAADVGMPSEPHRPTAAIRRVINPDAPARRQFGGPVRGDGHDQTFRTVGEDEGDVASDLARLAASQGTGRDGRRRQGQSRRDR